MTSQQPKKPDFILSLRDPLLLDKRVSPLLQAESELKGFIAADFWQSMSFAREPTDKVFFDDPYIKIAEHNFNKLCQTVQNSPRQNYSQPPQNPTIPAIIHFVWLGSPITPEFEAVIDTWKQCHAGWVIKIWTENNLIYFPWSTGYTKWLFEDAQSFGEKSDILRYEILYNYGGIYSDIDMICYRSFNDLIDSDFNLFVGQEDNHVSAEFNQILSLNNAVIGVSPKHSLIKYCLDTLMSKDESPIKSLIMRNGPGLLTRACLNELYQGDKDKILVLPCSYFYPLPCFYDFRHKMLTAQEINSHFISPESMGVHLWAGTWYATDLKHIL